MPDWNCQYIQANLGDVSRHDEIFTPPSEWQGRQVKWPRFDYVFDFSGETSFDKAELVSRALALVRQMYQWLPLVRKCLTAAPNLQHLPDGSLTRVKRVKAARGSEAAFLGPIASTLLRDEVIEQLWRASGEGKAEAGRKPRKMVARGSAWDRKRQRSQHGRHSLRCMVRAWNMGL